MKKTLTPEAEGRLEKVADWLAQGAPHTIMENGQEVGAFYMDYGINLTECGAVCCVAGALVQFNQPFSQDFIERNIGDEGDLPWAHTMERAMELLGLDSGTPDDLRFAEVLFRPGSIENRWITPNIAARVLYAYLATGVVDWEAYLPEGWDPDEFAEEYHEFLDWAPLEVTQRDEDDE